MLAQWFLQVNCSNRTKFLDGNPDDACYYQGTRETLVDTSRFNIGEDIMREALVTHTKEAAEVTSEEENTKASEVALTGRTVLSSKGRLNKRVLLTECKK